MQQARPSKPAAWRRRARPTGRRSSRLWHRARRQERPAIAVVEGCERLFVPPPSCPAIRLRGDGRGKPSAPERRAHRGDGAGVPRHRAAHPGRRRDGSARRPGRRHTPRADPGVRIRPGCGPGRHRCRRAVDARTHPAAARARPGAQRRRGHRVEQARTASGSWSGRAVVRPRHDHSWACWRVNLQIAVAASSLARYRTTVLRISDGQWSASSSPGHCCRWSAAARAHDGRDLPRSGRSDDAVGW